MEIDRDFLGSALTSGSGMACYFDRETGEVLPDDDFGTEWDEHGVLATAGTPEIQAKALAEMARISQESDAY